MAGMYDGGILSGFLDGWMKGEDRHREREQYESAKRKAAKQEQRSDTQWEQSQQDRVRDQAWQDEGRGVQREHWLRDATAYQQGQDDRAHALRRRPVLEAREDEAHAVGMEGRRAQLAAARQGMAFAAEDQADHRRARQREWDQASLQDEVTKAVRAVSPAFVNGMRTGDWAGMKDAWNSTMGQHNGQVVDDIAQGEDGRITVTVNGKPKAFNDAGEFQAFVSNALDPTAAFVQMDTTRRALEQRSLGLGPAGRGASVPAALQEADAVYQRLPAKEGESENERWMRAYAMTTQKAGMSPEQAGAGFYQALMKEAGGRKDAHERAMAATDLYMQTFYGQAPAARAAGAAPGHAPAPTGMAGAMAASPPAAAAQPRVVRTGTLPDGTRVAQLEDGSIVPLQQ